MVQLSLPFTEGFQHFRGRHCGLPFGPGETLILFQDKELDYIDVDEVANGAVPVDHVHLHHKDKT